MVPTCVHPRGTSAVDVSWANSAAMRLKMSWKLDQWLETLSDYPVYLHFGLPRLGRVGGSKLDNVFDGTWVALIQTCLS